MVIKLDMQNAYDKLESKFIPNYFTDLVSEKWTNWTMQCITAISFSVVVNGIPRGHLGQSVGRSYLLYISIICAKHLDIYSFYDKRFEI